MSSFDYICETEKIAAYIDGELDPSAHKNFERHIEHCATCSAELQEQRQFMCELDSALAGPFDLAVPTNFAQVVAVNAESDMRGVRDRVEHARALRFCIILSLAAFAMLGFTASRAIILNARLIAGKVVGVAGFFAKAGFDAAAGLTVISRVVTRGVVADSRLLGFVGFLLVALAIGLLSLLISRYHRARLIE
jgi:anti-sigma factor RsiW